MVSVIIPTYKRAQYIIRAIESVLNQTYKNIEIIVVDDNDNNSLDRKNMQKIMEKYSKNNKVKYLKHEKNMNGAAARNTGIKEAKGDYITFLDDDDFFLEDRIEFLVKEIEKNSDFSAIYTGGIVIKNKKIIDVFCSNLEGNFQNEILMQKPVIKTGSNMFFKANILRELGGFDTEFLRHQDLEILVRFFRKYKMKFLKAYSVVKDETSRINFPNIEKAIKMKELYFSKFKQDIESQKNKDEIYRENYKNLLNISKARTKEFKYITIKLLELGYEEDLKNKIKRFLKGSIIDKLYKRIKLMIKISTIDKDIIYEVKKTINKYQ